MVWQASLGAFWQGAEQFGEDGSGWAGNLLAERIQNMVYQPKKKYEWGDAGFVPNIDPNIVGGVFEHLEEKEGCVTKTSFLEFSRAEDSPTHDLFEWNDEVAAEKYRLATATKIISALRITYVNRNDEEVKVNAFIKTSEYRTAKYENIEQALADEGKRSIIINRIKGEVAALIQRNRNIEELADILIEAGMSLKNTK